MNFIEAVQALKDGKCEGIKHPAWSQKRSPQFLTLGDNSINWASGNKFVGMLSVLQMLSDDWELVNPKPQTETVEVIGWRRRDSDGKKLEYTESLVVVNGWQNQGCFFEVLHGTYQREVKPKVKRREEITLADDAQWRSVHANSQIPEQTDDGHFFYEWEEP